MSFGFRDKIKHLLIGQGSLFLGILNFPVNRFFSTFILSHGVFSGTEYPGYRALKYRESKNPSGLQEKVTAARASSG